MFKYFLIVSAIFANTLVNARGVVLEKISNNSILYQNGIRQGDTLLVIDNVPVTDITDILTIFSNLKGTKEVTMVILPAHQTKERKFDLKYKNSLPRK